MLPCRTRTSVPSSCASSRERYSERPAPPNGRAAGSPCAVNGFSASPTCPRALLRHDHPPPPKAWCRARCAAGAARRAAAARARRVRRHDREGQTARALGRRVFRAAADEAPLALRRRPEACPLRAAALAHPRLEIDRAVRFAALTAPAPLALRRRPEGCLLRAAALAHPRVEADRAVNLAAPAAPALLALRRRPEACLLRTAALAHSVSETRPTTPIGGRVGRWFPPGLFAGLVPIIHRAVLLCDTTPSHADVLHRRFQLVHLHLSRATLFPLEVRAPAPGGVNDSNDSIRGCS